MKTAICVLSGGLDSSVAMMIALAEGYTIPLAITFDYGQRAAPAEIRQSKALCDHFKVPHRTLSLPWFSEISKSRLTQKETELPQLLQSQLNNNEVCEASKNAVWVPNRNGILIEIAAGYAESLEASSVIVGFNREEAATFPDNSISYLVAIEKALFYSTKNHVKVICPTRTLDKKQIVRLAKERNFPFELLWSCYQNGNKMCGKCESCQRLKRAANGQMVGWENYFEDASLSG